MTTQTHQIPWILTNEGITVYVNGVPKNINKDHRHFEQIIEAINANDILKVESLVDVATAIVTKAQGRIQVADGEILFNGDVIDNSITRRILQAIEMGLEVDNMLKFLDRLQDNPSYRSREQLFGFLEACDLPILPDGTFLAYKSVNKDYWDTHTGRTFLNTLGSVIEMDRTKVDDDPNRTCSAGLHVCSQAYGMYGSLLLHVSVAPEDVVSVPNEYHQAKMRVCRYKVLEHAPDGEFKEWDTPVYAGSSEDENIEWDF